MSLSCSQCGVPAERCERCSSTLCTRRLCAELHEASCVAVSALPAGPIVVRASAPKTRLTRPRRERDEEAERLLVERLVVRITEHRQAGRTALLVGNLDTAVDELWAARELEPDLDHLSAVARQSVPREWESETDLTPLARALSSRSHPRAGDVWRWVLDDRPARSIQAEAAEWLARDAFGSGERRAALRMLHAASLLGRGSEVDAFHTAYKQAGLDPLGAFGLYLAASRLDPRTARAASLRDPLTDRQWSDQDPRWWLPRSFDSPSYAACEAGLLHEKTDHQLEALHRARDLARGKRDHGWLLLAEGDCTSGPLGVRSLGRNVRAGCAEPADEDAFVRIRMAYEGAADRLPDVAWPWYRLAELLAWAGFADRAQEHLAQAERRGLGSRDAARTSRAVLRALVQAGLGSGPVGLPTAARPFPAEPYGVQLGWRLRLR